MLFYLCCCFGSLHTAKVEAYEITTMFLNVDGTEMELYGIIIGTEGSFEGQYLAVENNLLYSFVGPDPFGQYGWVCTHDASEDQAFVDALDVNGDYAAWALTGYDLWAALTTFDVDMGGATSGYLNVSYGEGEWGENIDVGSSAETTQGIFNADYGHLGEWRVQKLGNKYRIATNGALFNGFSVGQNSTNGNPTITNNPTGPLEEGGGGGGGGGQGVTLPILDSLDLPSYIEAGGVLLTPVCQLAVGFFFAWMVVRLSLKWVRLSTEHKKQKAETEKRTADAAKMQSTGGVSGALATDWL